MTPASFTRFGEFTGSVFWTPGGKTWGIAGAPTSGVSASITRYETYYTRLDEPQ